MTVRELREKYLRFFESKGHTIHPSGSLIPYDVTGRLDESLLFNGAGMIQFKPYFRGIAEPENKRLTTCQKCVRTGDIDEVGDLSHLTFFEMLGNFSFGDYFKKEAIAFSWEFLTSPDWLGLDPNRLSFTVFQDDDEAYASWSEHIAAAGIDPATRIFRLGEDTNYWPAGAFSKGPPGPCGPNSEMFYWTSNEVPPPAGAYSVEDWVRDEDANLWLEIWNDVFIQYDWQGELNDPSRPSEGYRKTGMPNLPFLSIDTGMGLERTAAVLGGHRSVYDTDAFQPIIGRIMEISPFLDDFEREDIFRKRRIIADHIRTACFCIADGVFPGNTGRGYVLRRLLRRSILTGQQLGIEEPFMHVLAQTVIDLFGDHYVELSDRREMIGKTLQTEDELFRRTLKQGQYVLSAELKKLRDEEAAQLAFEALSTVPRPVPSPILPGQVAFQLYDTFGFPLEITREITNAHGIQIDEMGYESALKEAQALSRGSQGMDTVYGGVAVRFDFVIQDADDGRPTPTVFRGYDSTAVPAHIKGTIMEPEEEDGITRIVLALDQTPFYSAAGGQISDTGVIKGEDFEGKVTEVLKQDGLYIHEIEPTMLPVAVKGKPQEEATELLNKALLNRPVFAEVDKARRASIQRNHTATHLLHAALRDTLGKHVTQAGSYVGPDRLRFDFTHGAALSAEELAKVERIVNEQALENTQVKTYVDIPIAEARARGAMALFGEKYGDKVRMVEIGEFSRELCGGTHVRSTGEIGQFRIVSEASAASGVRRIEAVTGVGAYDYALKQAGELRNAAALVKSSPEELSRAIERLAEQLKEERRRREKAEAAALRGDSDSGSRIDLGTVVLWTKDFGDVDQKSVAASLDEAASETPNLVAVAAVRAGDKAMFLAKAGASAVASGAHAGNLVKELARITGGGGGGKAEFATAGARDLAKLKEALDSAESFLRPMLK